MKEPAWLGLALAIGVALMVGAVWVRRLPSSHPQDAEPFVSIAMVGIDRDAHVKQVLAAHAIPVATWGGAHSGYWVLVSDRDVHRAIEVLRTDAKKFHYYVHFGDQHPLALSEAKWIEYPVDLPYADLLGRPELSLSTEVRACLLQSEVATMAKTYSRISRIRHLRYRLFEAAPDGVVIEELWLVRFPEAVGGKRRSTSFQIFNGGEAVHCVRDTESNDY